jgi:hypothetical protein
MSTEGAKLQAPRFSPVGPVLQRRAGRVQPLQDEGELAAQRRSAGRGAFQFAGCDAIDAVRKYDGTVDVARGHCAVVSQ